MTKRNQSPTHSIYKTEPKRNRYQMMEAIATFLAEVFAEGIFQSLFVGLLYIIRYTGLLFIKIFTLNRSSLKELAERDSYLWLSLVLGAIPYLILIYGLLRWLFL